MIIGRGMIAKAFGDSNNQLSDCILFASGVSNSRCEDLIEFERELSLLKSTLKYNKRLIYFSTSSIFDPNLESSSYIKHKLHIESFIEGHFNEYIIYRLPNVVGKTKNKNTLINNFADAILTGTSVKLFKNSTRYIIDVDDVVNYVLLTKNTSNCIINLNFNINYSITKIWKEIELVLEKKGKALVIDQGSKYKIDNSLLISKLGNIEIPELNEVFYLRKTLQKYLSK
jgi:nucleoside-diphosphate-sugar epimerase